MTTLNEARGHRKVHRENAFLGSAFIAALAELYEARKAVRETRKAKREKALRLPSFK